MHSCHFIHRDIKPDNFLMGVGKDNHQVNIIDFGLAKKYRDPMTHLHILCQYNYALTGTAAFASINNHRGLEQSRRDDLESLAYVLIYLFRGSLPWYKPKTTATARRSNHSRMLRKKMELTPEVLCEECPEELALFLVHARTLQFDDRPDYAYLRKLFHDRLLGEGYQSSDPFDWQLV